MTPADHPDRPAAHAAPGGSPRRALTGRRRAALTIQAVAIATLLAAGGIGAAVHGRPSSTHRSAARVPVSAPPALPALSPRPSASPQPACPSQTPLPAKDHPVALPAGQSGPSAQLAAWRKGGGSALLLQIADDLRALGAAGASRKEATILTATCTLQNTISQAQSYAPLPTAAAQGPYADGLELYYRGGNDLIVAIQTMDADAAQEAGVEFAAAKMDFQQLDAVLMAIDHPPTAT